jgi:hypothetical protein
MNAQMATEVSTPGFPITRTVQGVCPGITFIPTAHIQCTFVSSVLMREILLFLS